MKWRCRELERVGLRKPKSAVLQNILKNHKLHVFNISSNIYNSY